MPDVPDAVLPEPIEVPDAVLPELAVPMLELLLVEPVPVEPVVVEDVVPEAVEPPGVPVVPIGVCCELCWPAPVAASFLAGLGGLPWAIAVPMTATAATPASRPLRFLDALMTNSLVV